MTDRLDSLQTLVEGIRREDAELRLLVGSIPRDQRDRRPQNGRLSVKDTLGHLAYWDDFTVHFFLSKVDPAACRVPPPKDFEMASCRAMATMADLPFGEVLARYLEATAAILDFLQEYWPRLTLKEREDFQIPLKHRRSHRLELVELARQWSLQESVDGAQEMSEPA